MRLDAFIESRRESWAELEAAIERAKGKPERLGGEGVRRLGTLYRGAAADLALARQRFPSDPVRAKLERLVPKAGLLVYEGTSRRSSLVTFFRTTYWQTVAERPWLLAAAWILLMGPAILGAFWAIENPDGASAFIPGEFSAATDPPSDAGTTAAQEAAFSVELFTHNIQVTFLGFALGITLGIGTGALLIFNGLLLGAVAGGAIEAGNGQSFAEFVIPHGPIELSCIVVTAAAGMRMGWALVEPGRGERRAALAAEAKTAVLVVLGTMPWLVAAGLLEAFVRSQGLPGPVLILAGVGTFAAYWGLVATRGRASNRALGAAPAPVGAPAAGPTPAPAPTP
jgi:uncharacterized membrane protein SpoIIM required for sporulation